MNAKEDSTVHWLNSPLINLYKKDDKYYFQILGENKKPVLTGKSFATKEKRDQALADVLGNFDALTFRKQGNRHYFTIEFSEGVKPISSRKFSSLAEMKAGISFLRENLLEKEETNSDMDDKQVKPEIEKADSTGKENLGDQRPLRYSFVVNFYSIEKEKGLRGKIEFPLTKEAVSFEGFDKEEIWKFIDKHIPAERIEVEDEELGQTVTTTSTTTNTNVSTTPSAKTVTTRSSAPTVEAGTVTKPIMGLINFQFFKDKRKVIGSSPTLFRSDSIDLQFNISKYVPQLKASRFKYETEVFAKPFDRQSKILVGSKEEDIFCPSVDDESANIVKLPLNLGSLTTGVLQIEAIFKLIALPEEGNEATSVDQGLALQAYGKAFVQITDFLS